MGLKSLSSQPSDSITSNSQTRNSKSESLNPKPESNCSKPYPLFPNPISALNPTNLDEDTWYLIPSFPTKNRRKKVLAGGGGGGGLVGFGI